MKISNKHKILIRLSGFILLLVAMVIIDNSFEPKENEQDEQAKTEVVAQNTIDGISSAPSELPKESRNTLPIKLVSNTQTTFAILQNFCANHFIKEEFKNEKNKRLAYSNKLQKQLIFYIITLANKDIQ